MTTLLWVVLLAATADTRGREGTPTLCRAAEVVFFSCEEEDKRRIISICGSADLSTSGGHLQYRFGRPGHVELQYPQHLHRSARQFRFYHYGRYQVERVGLIFRRAGYEYTIYSHYEGDDEPAQSFVGLTVIREANQKTLRDLKCRGPVTDRLVDLEEIVPCDEGNALAMGCQE